MLLMSRRQRSAKRHISYPVLLAARHQPPVYKLVIATESPGSPTSKKIGLSLRQNNKMKWRTNQMTMAEGGEEVLGGGVCDSET